MIKGFRIHDVAFSLSLVLANVGCGEDTAHFVEVETPAGSVVAEKRKNASAESNLRLIDAPRYTILIDGCRSGYRSRITEENPEIYLYKNDLSCVAKLLDFERDGKAFKPFAGKGFTTYQYGDSAVFTSEDGLHVLTVRVTRQLSSPTQAGDTVNYAFSELVESTQKMGILRTIFGSKGAVTGFLANPLHFNIRAAKIVNVVARREAVQVTYKFECEVPLKRAFFQSTFTEDSSCDGAALKNLKYVLVEDKMDGVPCRKTSDCSKFFNGNKGTAIETADVIAPGTEGLVNGGFHTKRTISDALISPSDVTKHPNMLLIIGGQNAYQWFNVDFDVQGSFHIKEAEDP